MVFVFLELRPYIAFGIKLKINVFHKCHQTRSVKIFPIFLKKKIYVLFNTHTQKFLCILLYATFSESMYAVMASNYSSVISVTVSEAWILKLAISCMPSSYTAQLLWDKTCYWVLDTKPYCMKFHPVTYWRRCI